MKTELLKSGKKAPAFNLPDKDGEQHKLSAFDESFVVIFFYPKDNTPGCTIEASSFSSNEKKFSALDTKLIGISGGDEKSKTKFCTKNKLKSLLLSDNDFSIAKKYGVYGTKKFMGKTFLGIHRVTYVLDSKRKIVRVFDKVKPAKHVAEVLEFIQGQ